MSRWDLHIKIANCVLIKKLASFLPRDSRMQVALNNAHERGGRYKLSLSSFKLSCPCLKKPI